MRYLPQNKLHNICFPLLLDFLYALITLASLTNVDFLPHTSKTWFIKDLLKYLALYIITINKITKTILSFFVTENSLVDFSNRKPTYL